MNIQNIISISIIGLNVIPIVLYMMTKDPTHLMAFAGMLSSIGISEYIKHIIIKHNSCRPEGAMDCNLYCNDGPSAGKPGMPSSHAAGVTFFIVFYWKYLPNHYFRMGLILYYFLIVQSRYYKRCHTILQLLTGTLVGLGMGAGVKMLQVRYL